MEVKVETKCGRCKKAEEKSMPLEEAGKLEQEGHLRIEAAASLVGEFNKHFGSSSFPDIVVAVRGPEGNYTVKTLDGLCERPGAARNKGCSQKVANHIEAIFAVEPPKKRVTKPKPPGGAATADPPKKNPPKGKGK